MEDMGSNYGLLGVLGTLALAILGLVRVIEATLASAKRMSQRPPAAPELQRYTKHREQDAHDSERIDERERPVTSTRKPNDGGD